MLQVSFSIQFLSLVHLPPPPPILNLLALHVESPFYLASLLQMT